MGIAAPARPCAATSEGLNPAVAVPEGTSSIGPISLVPELAEAIAERYRENTRKRLEDHWESGSRTGALTPSAFRGLEVEELSRHFRQAVLITAEVQYVEEQGAVTIQCGLDSQWRGRSIGLEGW